MNILVFGVADNQAKTIKGLERNLALAAEKLPDFEVWVYVDAGLGSFTLPIAGAEVQRRDVPDIRQRFFAVDESGAGVVFQRSLEGRLTDRDVWCIRAFMADPAVLHVIRDHPSHVRRGFGEDLWGIKKWTLPKPLAEMAGGQPPADFGKLLAEVVYPQLADRTLVHTNLEKGPGRAKIAPRTSGDFAGNPYDGAAEKPLLSYFDELAATLGRLRQEKWWDLSAELLEQADFGKLDPEARRAALYEAYVANYYLGEIDECRQILGQFEESRVECAYDQRLLADSNCIFGALKGRGYRIVGTCDPAREPREKEVVISFGSYPFTRDHFPWRDKVYRHAAFWRDVAVDAFESAPCWDAVERIYIINLKEREDLLHASMIELARMGAPLDRVRLFEAIKPEGIPNTVNRGTVGCYMSHTAVLREIVDRGYRHCLVLEDDNAFTSRVGEAQRSLGEFFRRGYDYDVCLTNYGPLVGLEPLDDLVSLSFQNWTTTSGYLVSRQGAAKLARLLEPEVATLAARLRDKDTTRTDQYILDFYWGKIQKDRKFLCFKERLGYQRSAFSSIRGQTTTYLF